jgi:FMN reductase
MILRRDGGSAPDPSRDPRPGHNRNPAAHHSGGPQPRRLADRRIRTARRGLRRCRPVRLRHQFRPLFSFFQALTLPLGVYASDADFVDYRIDSEVLRERIAQAVARGVPIVRGTLPDQVSEFISTW